MTRTIQLLRGTTAQNDAFTGAAGEVTVDTTTHELRVHDGSTQGGHKIGKGYRPDLFDHKWADHIINDVQWLRGDTFSWQDGTVYATAYDHLADDIDGKSLSSETIGSTTVQFYLADDGHKICPASEESNVAAIYTATGVAWYYIIDTTNTRFKLPRTKFGMTGLRDTVGNYVAPGLPNIAGLLGGTIDWDRSGPFSSSGQSTTLGSGSSGFHNTMMDLSVANSIYGNSTTVQAPATQMYLYFYVGEFTQTALENTAGLNAELFNDKADITSILPMIAPDYANGVVQTATTTEQTYTCPSAGWIVVDLAGFNNNYCYLYINDVLMFNKTTNGSGSLMGATGQYFVSAGDICKFKSGYNNGTTFAANGTLTFFPCKGV